MSAYGFSGCMLAFLHISFSLHAGCFGPLVELLDALSLLLVSRTTR